MTDTTEEPSRDASLIEAAIKRIQNDTGFKAILRRADNPSMEYKCWDYLVAWGIGLDYPNERLPYTMVLSALARAGVNNNGALSLGAALAMAYDGRSDSPAIARLRRLLACDSLEELVMVLRPLLKLIDSRVTDSLNYIRLLGQLKRFAFNQEDVKVQWAKEFYRHAKQPQEIE